MPVDAQIPILAGQGRSATFQPISNADLLAEELVNSSDKYGMLTVWAELRQSSTADSAGRRPVS